MLAYGQKLLLVDAGADEHAAVDPGGEEALGQPPGRDSWTRIRPSTPYRCKYRPSGLTGDTRRGAVDLVWLRGVSCYAGCPARTGPQRPLVTVTLKIYFLKKIITLYRPYIGYIGSYTGYFGSDPM